MRNRTLRELRIEAGLTQEEVARRLGWRQGQVSRHERDWQVRIGRFRDHVEALGGRLEVVVKVGRERFLLETD